MKGHMRYFYLNDLFFNHAGFKPE